MWILAIFSIKMILSFVMKGTKADMDIEELETFLAVERYHSFTKAAEELFCTQAAISMRIKRLETSLETPLFVRKSRTVELTHQGEIFLPYALQMVNTSKSAREHLLQDQLMEESEIHITCSSTPGTYIIPSMMYLFRQKHPYITVLNHVQYTRNVIAAVLDNVYPLGIVSQPAQVDTGELMCEPLMDDPLVIVVNPHHPWAKSTGIELKQLAKETFLISNPNTSMVGYLEHKGGFTFNPAKLYVAGNLEAIKRSIYSSQGISVMSEYAVRQELDLGLLCRVPTLSGTVLSRQIYSLRRYDQELKLSTRLFLQFVRESTAQGVVNPA
ncbi:MAG: LysR family transcriptional regulator [Angelakisella sp.]|nr:LysR family transcriptional regulator [Angelakisella sp.]